MLESRKWCGWIFTRHPVPAMSQWRGLFTVEMDFIKEVILEANLAIQKPPDLKDRLFTDHARE